MTVVVDQIVAATQEAEFLCGGNSHLAEDECIRELVEFAANGRHTDAFDLLIGDAIEARVRVLPSDPEASARYAHEPAVPTGKRGCERCGVPYGPAAERTTPDWWDDAFEGRDGTRHTLWVAAGSSVVEIVMCRVCADYLSADFAPVVWRQPMAGKSVSHSESWWATAAPPHVLRCNSSYKSTGEQCRRVAVDGSIVCDQHGGAAGHVRRRAAERIAFTADDAARNLVTWMNDPAVNMRERVKITQDLLDRAGLAAAQVHKIMPITEDPIEAVCQAPGRPPCA